MISVTRYPAQCTTLAVTVAVTARGYRGSKKTNRGVIQPVGYESELPYYHEGRSFFEHVRPKEAPNLTCRPSFDGIDTKPELLSSRLCMVTNCQSAADMPENIAYALAKYGANVVVHSKSAKEARRIRDSLPITHAGQQHFSVAADLGNPKAASQHLVDQLQQVAGSLEVVIHNAGLPKAPPVDVMNCSLADFNKVVDLNLKSPFALTQALLPLMAQAKRPSIIFASNEVAGPEGAPMPSTLNSAYYVNKFGVKSSHMLTSLLSRQLNGIRVNAVDPCHGLDIDDVQESARAFVWLAREDTEASGSTLNSHDWIKRDPSLFTRDY